VDAKALLRCEEYPAHTNTHTHADTEMERRAALVRTPAVTEFHFLVYLPSPVSRPPEAPNQGREREGLGTLGKGGIEATFTPRKTFLFQRSLFFSLFLCVCVRENKNEKENETESSMKRGRKTVKNYRPPPPTDGEGRVHLTDPPQSSETHPQKQRSHTTKPATTKHLQKKRNRSEKQKQRKVKT
jgi:hypothetical protein